MRLLCPSQPKKSMNLYPITKNLLDTVMDKIHIKRLEIARNEADYARIEFNYKGRRYTVNHRGFVESVLYNGAIFSSDDEAEQLKIKVFGKR